MKVFLSLAFLGYLTFFPVLQLHSQYIIAGQHDAGCYFNPDTTIKGPDNHPPVSLPPAIFPVDINGDGIDDVAFYSRGWWVNSFGWSELNLRICDTVHVQTAHAYTDTCYTFDSAYIMLTRDMAKPFRDYDTIDRNLNWQNKTQYLAYTSWALGTYRCSVNVFQQDPSVHYIAVRLFWPGDTVYGWILVSNVHPLTCTIRAFACHKQSSGTGFPVESARIFPDPAFGIIQTETRWPECDLTVYNQYGEKIMRMNRIPAGRTRIDISDRNSGIYYFRFVYRDQQFVKKVIKL